MAVMKIAIVLLVAAVSAVSVSATATYQLPVPGCSKKLCDNAKYFNYFKTFGVYNTKKSGDTCLLGSVNATAEKTPNDCCNFCRTTPGCGYWHYYPSAPVKTGCSNGAMRRRLLDAPAMEGLPGVCYLLQLKPGCVPAIDYSTQCGTSVFGGQCNPDCKDDPHLQGARGTPYDFNGALNKPFCLVSDKDLHINMFLGGYLDANTTAETIGAQQNGHALRSWAKELGIIYKKDGQEHKVHLVARKGKEQARGNGFLAAAEVDGKAIVIPAVGATTDLPAGATFTFVGYEKKGPYDMDHFTLTIPDLMTMDIRMRVANPKLQAENDAEVHFNMGFTSLKVTPQVHGVLGQTYREDRERIDRAVKYSALANLLGHNVQVDGESGKGFLDGESADYISTSVLSPDCKFAQYQTEAVIELPSAKSS